MADTWTVRLRAVTLLRLTRCRGVLFPANEPLIPLTTTPPLTQRLAMSTLMLVCWRCAGPTTVPLRCNVYDTRYTRRCWCCCDAEHTRAWARCAVLPWQRS